MSPPRPTNRRNGFALPLVIWGLGIIALLIVSFMTTARWRAQAAYNIYGAAKADLLADSAVNIALLQLLAEKPSRAVDYVAWFLDRLTREEAQRYYEHYVGPYFVPGRTADLDVAQQAIDAVAAELGIAPVPAEAMYGLAGKSIANI